MPSMAISFEHVARSYELIGSNDGIGTSDVESLLRRVILYVSLTMRDTMRATRAALPLSSVVAVKIGPAEIFSK